MSYTTFFYDQQIRRFLLQFIRIMSNFQIRLGNDNDGDPVYQRVPVFYADANRQASQILRSNSENTIKAVPAMAVHINQLIYDRERVQEPNFVSKMNLRTKVFNEVTNQYIGQQEGAYTVERLMPVPYKLVLKVDVWTSNTEQKLMLLEQIMVLFNPAMEIQSTDNYIDWTSLSYILLTEITWSNRTVPAGTEENIDIASLTFDLPIWISAPAKVKQLGVIQKIISTIHEEDFSLEISSAHLTFENYGVIFEGNTLRLIKQNEITASDDGSALSAQINLRQRHNWLSLINLYGNLTNGLSKIYLLQSNGSEVVGTVAYHPTDETLLLFTPFTDTLPSNTLQPIHAIINPYKIDVDSQLLTPAVGTRYLLTQPIGSLSDDSRAVAWNDPMRPELIANANDIIQYNGLQWTVVFNSSVESLAYVTNMATGVQYKWNNGAWSKSVEGRYDNAHWRIAL